VVHEVMTTTIPSAAPVAAEGFLTLVDERVRLELIRVGEARGAELARVRSFAGVHPEVAPQVRHLNELTLAVGAVVGFLARVQTHVRLEVVVSGEAFVALGTREGFFARVRALVVLQHVLVAETPVAHSALEHLQGKHTKVAFNKNIKL
jgi:hypothetical protein